jgi:hypothetical protein
VMRITEHDRPAGETITRCTHHPKLRG